MPPPETPRPAVGYLASRYPSISHTFILREVLSLRAQGWRIETATVRAPDPAVVISDADREAARTTRVLVPPTAAQLARAHLGALLRHPAAYLGTLGHAWRVSPPGARAHLWQLFYFAEALLAWRWAADEGLGHLHAHFANVGSDVAWLAAEFGRRARRRPWSWTFTMHGATEFFDVEGFNLAAKTAAADGVACISDFCRSQLAGLVDPDCWPKLAVVRCGVDAQAFAPTPRRPGVLGTPEVPLRVLNIGRLVPDKGQVVLLDAVATLARRGIHTEVVMAGDGPLRRRLERRARRLGVGEQVAFPGFVSQDEIRRLYAETDVFCLPSFAEGLPVVLMEAMACEVPVVTTPIAAIGELVEDGVSGLLVRPARSDLIADALQRLAEDATLRERLGVTGRRYVIERHDPGRAAEQLGELFTAVYAAPRPDAHSGPAADPDAGGQRPCAPPPAGGSGAFVASTAGRP